MTAEETKLELLKKKIDDLRVKKLSNDKELERLTKDLEERKNNIKNKFGVKIEEFSSAISIMKEEFNKKTAELEKMVSEAEEKMKE